MLKYLNLNISSPNGAATKKQGRRIEALNSLRRLLGFVNIRSYELAKLSRSIQHLERLVKAGQISRARKYGNYIARSYKMIRASAHSVLRDTTSPGLGANYRLRPWKLNIQEIQTLCKAGKRMRVWLDKPDGGLRPLAVPELRDRILERSLLTVMEILAAPVQSQASIGFRYNQDISRGLQEMLGKAIRKYGAEGFNLLDTDFRKYYDTIPHSGLRTILRKLGIRGRNWRYICSSLKAPVMSSEGMMKRAAGKIEGPMAQRCYNPEMGTPQGCVISPLLANLYGAGLDKRLEESLLPYLRYADNLLVAYPAEWIKEKAIGILEKLKPEATQLHEDKTQTLEGDGALVTLGSVIRRSLGKISLFIASGYLGKPARRVRKVQQPWGGIPYMGQVFDFLRNLPIHSSHQNYTDRRSWSRHVGNTPIYIGTAMSEAMRGGVWRQIEIQPQLKGTMRLLKPDLLTVKGWEPGVGLKSTDLMEEVRKAGAWISELKHRCNSILDLPLRKLSSNIIRLCSKMDDQAYPYVDVGKIVVRKTYKLKESKFQRELKAKVLISQDKAEWSWNDLRIIGEAVRYKNKSKARMPKILREGLD